MIVFSGTNQHFEQPNNLNALFIIYIIYYLSSKKLLLEILSVIACFTTVRNFIIVTKMATRTILVVEVVSEVTENDVFCRYRGQPWRRMQRF